MTVTVFGNLLNTAPLRRTYVREMAYMHVGLVMVTYLTTAAQASAGWMTLIPGLNFS